VVLLMNSKALLETEIKNQQEIASLLLSKKIKASKVDAASEQKFDQHWNKRLHDISKKESYPQVFASDGEGDYLFIGGYQDIKDEVEDGSLYEMLGLKLLENGQFEIAKGPPRDELMIQRDFFQLEKYKGAKIWKLTEKEREELWDVIDFDKNGYLSVYELHDFAEAFWEEQMARGDDRKDYIAEHSYSGEHQIRLLEEALQEHVDLDHHGKIEKKILYKIGIKLQRKHFRDLLHALFFDLHFFHYLINYRKHRVTFKILLDLFGLCYPMCVRECRNFEL